MNLQKKHQCYLLFSGMIRIHNIEALILMRTILYQSIMELELKEIYQVIYENRREMYQQNSF